MIALALGPPAQVFGLQTVPVDASVSVEEVERAIESTGANLLNTVTNPSLGSVGGEWAVLGLVRSGVPLPEAYLDTYYQNVSNTLLETKGVLSRSKYSEYSRLILALTAIGKDVTSVAGYALSTYLADLEAVKKQGVNGPIYALIALDSAGYEMASREALIQAILSKELATGGFSLGETTANPDVTAFAIQALAGYQDRAEIKQTIDRAIQVLFSTQKETETLEGLAQMIIAYTAVNIDPETDPRLMSRLMDYQLSDGSFCHIPGGGTNAMSTEQAMLALVAYQRFLDGSGPLYDMRDVIPKDEYKVQLNGRYVQFDQPPIHTGTRILVPMRAIFEALQAEVDWDAQKQEVTGTIGQSQVVLIIGERVAYVNGKPVELDEPSRLVGGRTMVPVRFIAESLEAEVIWRQESKTVDINQ
jgi:hypothetical protein